MKTKLFYAVLMAITLLSCNQSDSYHVNSDRIYFSSYTGLSATKALDKTTFKGGDAINVSAFKHEGDLNNQLFVANFFDNLTVTGTGVTNELPTDWSYDDIRYWPTNSIEKLSFVASHNHPITIDGGSIMLKDFTVEALAPNQKDLLWAGTPNKATSDGTPNTVDLTFKHVLSRVLFKAKLKQNYQNATLKIIDIEIVDIINKGTYTFGAIGANATDWTSGTWAPSVVAADVSTYSAIPSDIEITAKQKLVGQSLFLLPQTVTAKNIKVTYTITFTSTGTTDTFTQTIVPKKEWESNTQYTYNLIFTIDNTISFGSATCNEWDEPMSL